MKAESSRRALLAWGLLRVPIALLLLYVLRYQVIAEVEQRYDIIWITVFAIEVLGTPLTRVLCSAALAILVISSFALLRKRGKAAAYAGSMALAAVFVAVSFAVTKSSLWIALLPLGLLAANLAPLETIVGRLWRPLAAFGAGVVELLSFRTYLRWIASLIRNKEADGARGEPLWEYVPGIALAAAVFGLTLNGWGLVPVEQALRLAPETRVLARGAFNWIELDDTRRYVYAAGHGFDHIMRFDRLAQDPGSQPLKTDTSAGLPQGFAYVPQSAEIYSYNMQTRLLQLYDATSLKLQREMQLPDLSPGDPWVAVDSESNTIAIASEADVRSGQPFVVIDKTTGETLDKRNLEAGNLLLHPSRPVLYLSFFRRRTGVIAYDLVKREIVAEGPADERVDRMAFWAKNNELLVASPVGARVLRYDADTLAFKGEIPASLGVRVLAIDHRRDLLFCGSLVTGTVAIVDLRTQQRVASYYLGPWIRTVVADPESGVAYVTSNGGLFELRYGGPGGSTTAARERS